MLDWKNLGTFVRLGTVVFEALVAYARTPEGAKEIDSLIADFSDDGQLNNSDTQAQPEGETVAPPSPARARRNKGE